MRCRILHEIPGRMRVRMLTGKTAVPGCTSAKMTLEEADLLEYALRSLDGVREVKVFDRTGDAIIGYSCPRKDVISALSRFSFDTARKKGLVPDHTPRALNREYEEKLVSLVCRRAIRKLFFPAPVRNLCTAVRAVHYVKLGIGTLLKGKIEVTVLDAAAVAVSVLRGDFTTASSVMFLLHIGELLEEWTHKKSVGDLAAAMSLGVEKTWMKLPGGEEILVPVENVKAGDTVVVRTGGMIPLDGHVIAGDCNVNQASITGESLPVHKSAGSYVYAGTTAEDGELVISVDKAMGTGRYDRIVKMIEESEKLKSASEAKAAHLADALVPWSLGGTLLTWVITRNAVKALSILMVDFSCALKLAMPLATLSAMREASLYDMTVKGGKFLEAVAEADTVVFDKTGTLTHASPRVVGIVSFGGRDPDEMLRLAACLEEHFPHSIARAVVDEALRRGLNHEERHSTVEYVVAHGISSCVDGERVQIGSWHFIFEDEGNRIPEEEQAVLDSLPSDCSHLYLAVGGMLAAVITIRDPLREEAAEVVKALRSLGVSKTVMMTGDSERTAKAVASAVGVDAYFSEVLPEDKAAFIRQEHERGRKVLMLGDGVNDSPALSEADAGIAVQSGAAIAREIADITVSAEDLHTLVILRQLSQAYMKRIHANYRFIIGFNLTLILLGVIGFMPPAASAMLHNLSTLAVGGASMRKLI